MLPTIVKHGASLLIACGTGSVITYKAHEPIKKAIHKVYHKKPAVRHYTKPKPVKAPACVPIEAPYRVMPFGPNTFKDTNSFTNLPDVVLTPQQPLVDNTPITPTSWYPQLLPFVPGGAGPIGYPGGGGGGTPPVITPPPLPPESSLPETSTWMMVIVGFGMMGGALRYSHIKVKRKVNV